MQGQVFAIIVQARFTSGIVPSFVFIEIYFSPDSTDTRYIIYNQHAVRWYWCFFAEVYSRLTQCVQQTIAEMASRQQPNCLRLLKFG